MCDVLVIDDDVGDRVMVRRALKRFLPELRVDEVEDGAQAVDYLLRKGDYAGLKAEPLPRLVFVDHKLPYFSGTEVLLQVKSQDGFEAVPMLMLTSSDNEADRVAALAAGASEFLRKPARYEEYMALIQQAAGRWLGMPRRVEV